MWTDGRADVCRSEAQTVFRAWVGRRSISSRGAEVERSEARRVESNVSATAIHRNRRESPSQGDGWARSASGGPEGVNSGDRSWWGGRSEFSWRERSEGASRRPQYGRDLQGAGL